MAELALQLKGEYITYRDFQENREHWTQLLKKRDLSPWILAR